MLHCSAEFGPGHVFGQDKVEIAGDGGEAGQWSEAAGGLEETFKQRESEFGDSNLIVEFAGIQHFTAEFSDPAEEFAVNLQFGTSAVVEFGASGR